MEKKYSIDEKILALKNSNKSIALITFGCSWTYGVGVNYYESITKKEYMKSAWDNHICDEYSFRGKISSYVDAHNLNMGEGGSSNKRQFRFARELFSNSKFNDAVKNKTVLVLWAITSTARNEIWDNELGEYDNFKYDVDASNLHLKIFKHMYNHDIEVKNLSEQMFIWNGFFKSMNIENIWLDTFNTHEYTIPNDNFIKGGDLMTQMLDNKIKSNSYHMSSWVNDDSRINDLLGLGYLNPYTFHPTSNGHEKISEILIPCVEKIIQS